MADVLIPELVRVDGWRGRTAGTALMDPDTKRIVAGTWQDDPPRRRFQRQRADYLARARWRDFVLDGGLWTLG